MHQSFGRPTGLHAEPRRIEFTRHDQCTFSQADVYGGNDDKLQTRDARCEMRWQG